MARDKNSYTPMMRQYLSIKEDYSDAIVFFRLGDFYEMFFEDALVASKELEIQLTARDGGGEKVPMCGVPHHSSDAYISRLVDKGYKVAICEQTELPTKGKKLVNRDVIRLVTPGTNIDEQGIESYHIAAVGLYEYFYTISYLNVSTGEMGALRVPKNSGALINELSTIQLREIVISHHFDKRIIEAYAQHEGITLSIHNDATLNDTLTYLFEDLPTNEEKKTTKRLLSYIMTTQKRTLLHLKAAEHIEASSYLRMDAGTLRHLELTRTMIKNKENGSLFWLLNHTKTAMGARFLKRQILRPSVNKDTLNTRYDFIDRLNSEFIVRDDLSELLKNVYDLERIVGRISYGNTNAKDLVQLRRSLSILPAFKDTLNALDLEYSNLLASSLNPLSSLKEELNRAFVDNPPITIKEGGMFKEGYDETLDNLKDIHLNVNAWLKKLEEDERVRTGIKKLKIGYNRVFGYYIEVPKGQIKNVLDEYGYTRKQTLANAERYVTEALKEKEKVILSSEEKSVKREYVLFTELRDKIREHIPAIQENASLISEVDMILSLSHASEKMNLARPTLRSDRQIDIEQGFHPVVQAFLEESFIPNDIRMNDDTDILLITGPNMSGKSTYMRQLAITAIMAQIGSFVPAKKASIPVFDQLFTRIGASDDLISGKSTFMVEMLDANHAIKHATRDSLIIFDEIGRGTSTYDGLAIAQAIIEYIHEKIGAKTLFSTHYHELTQLEETLTKLKNVHVAAKEEGDTIKFHHLVKDGKADKSYGINVASLAALPPSLIKRSKTILTSLENSESEPSFNLFSVSEDRPEENNHQAIIDALERSTPDEMTPLEALNKLYELKNALKNDN
jgi:DNA mismatch repair protein MutS